MNGTRHLNSILSVFSTEIFLNNISTISTKKWPGMLWKLNLIATHYCILFLSFVSSYKITRSHCNLIIYYPFTFEWLHINMVNSGKDSKFKSVYLITKSILSTYRYRFCFLIANMYQEHSAGDFCGTMVGKI